MKQIFLLCILTISICCKMPMNANKNDNKTIEDSTLISLEKTACFGKCPVFKITIYKNGLAIYDGQINVEKKGRFEKKIPNEEIKQLIKSFEESHFFDFKDKYTADMTDLPSTYLTFNNKGKSKKIIDYYDAPDKLKELEAMVENIANKDGWVKKEL